MTEAVRAGGGEAAAEPDTDAVPEFGSEAVAAVRVGRLRRVGAAVVDAPVLAAAILAVVVALAAAGWFGRSWYDARNEADGYSALRDDALRAGEQAVVNLNTLDYRDIDGGLKTWQDSTTAELYSQIAAGRSNLQKRIGKAKTTTTAKVLDAALTELNDHAGKARIILALRVTVTPAKGDPVVKQTRLVGQLTKTAEGWKLSALGQAPAGTTG